MARLIASSCFHVEFEKDQSTFRLVATSDVLRYDRDTRKYTPASVGVSVTRSDGEILEEDCDPADYGLKIYAQYVYTDGTVSAAMDVTSAPGLNLGQVKLLKELSQVDYTLRRTLALGEAPVDNLTIKIDPIARDGEPATMYELFSTNAVVHFDANGSTTSEGVTVVPFKVTGSAGRVALDVTSSNSEFVCLFSRTQKEMTIRRTVYQKTTLSKADVATLTYGRFDLIRRADVTFHTLSISGGGSDVVQYSDNDVLASREVIIVKDGSGEPGEYPSMVFCRQNNQPFIPQGGTYSNSVPQPGDEHDSPWYDAPPQGSAKLWMSKARIKPSMTGVGNAPKPEWSMPVLVDNSADLDVIWSPLDEPANPSNTHKPYVADGVWSYDDTDAVWMAMSVKSEGVWQPWSVCRIRGEGAVSIQVSPANVVAPGGKTPKIDVIVRMYIGQKQVYLTQDMLCGLFGEGIGPGPDPVTGIRWTWYNKANSADKDVGYHIFSQQMAVDSATYTPHITYRGQTYPFTVQFATAPQGTGKTGPFAPPPMQWSDYPVGYKFQTGEDADDTRCDTVYHGQDKDGNFFVYKCKQAHDKSLEANPTTKQLIYEPRDGSPYWEFTMKAEILAGKVIMGDKGYIGLFSSQAIRIYNEANEVVGQFCSPGQDYSLPFFIGGVMDPDNGSFTNPTGPLMAINSDGKAFFGGTEGKRIEIDPGGKLINVYDDSGSLCARHSGDIIDRNEVMDRTQSSVPITVAASVMNSSNSNITPLLANKGSLRLIPAASSSDTGVTATATGKLRVTIPSFRLYAMTGSMATGSDGQLVRLSESRVWVTIEVDGKVREQSLQWYVINDEKITVGYTIETAIKKGEKYVVRLYCELIKTGTASNPGTATFAAQGTLSAQIRTDEAFAHFGANGFYIAHGNENYFYAFFDSSGKLQLEAKSDNKKIL